MTESHKLQWKDVVSLVERAGLEQQLKVKA